MEALDEPFNAYCAPLEARSVVLRDASVLMAKCPIASNQGPLFPHEFWFALVEAHEVHFLVPDPVEASRRLKRES